jgi:gamma-glutamylcyclotransferase
MIERPGCGAKERREVAIKYYAYGSNLLSSRLLARIPAESLGMAALPGYALRWNLHSLDGSGKCNITKCAEPDAVVHGVLYEIPEERFPTLDAIEQGYDRIQVVLRHRGEDVEASTYIYAKPAPDAPPYVWYRALVVAGAIEHGFPEHVVEGLQGVPARSDPASDRPGKLHAEELLRSGGYAFLLEEP